MTRKKIHIEIGPVDLILLSELGADVDVLYADNGETLTPLGDLVRTTLHIPVGDDYTELGRVKVIIKSVEKDEL